MVAQTDFVNLPLTAAWKWRWWPVVERHPEPGRIAAAAAIATLAIVLAQFIFGGGGFFSDTKGGIARLEDQYRQLNARFDVLSKKFDDSPRSDQLLELTQTLAKLSGRVESDENQLHQVQTQQAVTAARQEAIDAASRLRLPGK